MKPSVRLLACTQLEPDFAAEVGLDPLKLIEYAGRWDYGSHSLAKMKPDDISIIGRWLESGEESMVEMVDVAFLIECSRVVTHELVRHRAGMSFQQESQRYVKYEDEDPDELMYVPSELSLELVEDYLIGVRNAHWLYKILRSQKVTKQIARYVLPNATRTRIIAKGNLRSWRHILKLRLHSSAQPEMRDVMRLVHAILVERFPVLFAGITGEERATR